MAKPLPAVRTPGTPVPPKVPYPPPERGGPLAPKATGAGLVLGPVHPMAVVEDSMEPVEAVDPRWGPRPWERMERETDAASALFTAFRDMAFPEGPGGRYVPRSLTALASASGISHRYLRELSASFHWFSRAGAFDRALDAAKAEADITEVRRTRLRHTRLLAKARLALEGELDKWLQRSADPEVSSMSPREVMQGLEALVKMERLLVGEATDHVRVEDGGWDLEALELGDLEKLEAIRRKAKGKG